jgi:hypothetical protein
VLNGGQEDFVAIKEAECNAAAEVDETVAAKESGGKESHDKKGRKGLAATWNATA